MARCTVYSRLDCTSEYNESSGIRRIWMKDGKPVIACCAWIDQESVSTCPVFISFHNLIQIQDTIHSAAHIHNWIEYHRLDNKIHKKWKRIQIGNSLGSYIYFCPGPGLVLSL